MARISKTYYIAPSSISITPNANGLENDLAVYIIEGAMIKVLAPKIGIGYDSGTFKTWRFTGRNRRLATSTLPYTIYIRLPKNSMDAGYLVFAPKKKQGEEWGDKYAYITRDSLVKPQGSILSEDYWFVRLGDVSLPNDGKRTVTLDTGVLGTDQYNTFWTENADELPLRVELGCTIKDEDAGQTPYVHWEENVLLTAMLMKGWGSVDVERFHHWEISRNSGDAINDALWSSLAKQAGFKKTGSFTLKHTRGKDDDFNGSMSAVFTITALGTPEADSTNPTDYVVMASKSITILSETIEKYDLAVSSLVVCYNPQIDEYIPKVGVKVHIRSIDQRGNVKEISLAQLKNEHLSVAFAPADSSVWTPIIFNGSDTDIAEATIGTATIVEHKSLNVLLTKSTGTTDSTDSITELSRVTIVFVRDGDDSHEREWIFLRSKTAIVFGENITSQYPLPSLITNGEVKPKLAATDKETNKYQNSWVPQGWWDRQQGVDSEWRYEYGAFRDYERNGMANGDSSSGGRWGDFSIPRLWNHYGTDGGKPVSRYQWSKSATEAPYYDVNQQDLSADWHADVPARPEGQEWYLWLISGIKNADGTYSKWGNPIRMTGDKGESPVLLTILTDRGNIIRNGQGNVTLTAVLTQEGIDITDTYPSTAFSWTRSSGNAEYDKNWNARHTAVGKTIIINAEDVWKRAVFDCIVEK